MNQYHDLAIESMILGSTRIEMLLGLYDHTISTVKQAESAQAAGDNDTFVAKLIDCNRCMLALHSGLNTEEYPIAVDVARLLNYVMLQIEKRDLAEAIKFLEKLHGTFSQIRDEATAMEKDGKIPPLDDSTAVNTYA